MRLRFPGRILSVALLIAPLLAASDASVSGVVLNDSTGKPVNMAMVTLATTGAKPMEASVYTDASGAFRFDAVPPGRYYMRAGEFRYQTVSYGAPTPDRYPAILTLGGGEIRQGIELRMRPLGAISGVVLDQDGDPYPHANLQLLASTWVRGRKTVTVRNNAMSNERGEFRLFAIAPGRYFLAATAHGPQTAALRSQVTIGEAEPDLVFGKTYYPNATRIQDARAVEVAPGADIHDLSVQLNTTVAATVTGRVELPAGVDEKDNGVAVSLMPQDESVFRPVMSVVANNGFTMTGIAPGRYEAITTVRGEDDFRGVDEVDLQPGSQEVVLHLQKGVRLAGRLEVQGGGAVDLTQYHITLIPVDPGAMRRNRLTAQVDKDGAFAFPAVTQGIWDIGAQPVPKGGYVKSMKLGDQDVLTEEMMITPNTSASLQVVVSTRGGAVSGTVKRPDGGKTDVAADVSGLAPATVLLVPVGRFSHVGSFRMMRPAEDDSKYELRGITPGSYKIFAFERLDRNSSQDPDFVARIDSLGKPVEVHEGDQINMDLDLLPAPPAAPDTGDGGP